MSASGVVSSDRFNIKRKYELLWQQPEMASHVMGFLRDTDVVTASGVCMQWYHAAVRELRMRGKALYRWPQEPPTSASTLYVSGDKGLAQVLEVCKDIKVLEISFDEPSKLPSKLITKASENNLKKLILRNVIFNSDNAKALLSSEIPAVEIYTKYRRHMSKKSRKILLDNKELFTRFVIQNRQPHSFLYGVYPNPLILDHYDTLDHGRVILEAVGVIAFRFGSSLTHLNISSGFHLTKKDLLQLSALNLKSFAVSCCNIPEEEWSDSFQNGFTSLSFLCIIDCKHLGLDTIKHISNKSKLTSLVLDLRHLPQVGECILILHDCITLTRLKLMISQESKLSEDLLFEKKWKQLRDIIIENYGFIRMKKDILENLVRKYRFDGIRVKYYNNYTLQRSTLELNKNLQPIVVE